MRLRCCPNQNPADLIFRKPSMQRNCQICARGLPYTSLKISYSLTNELRFCVLRGNKSSQYNVSFTDLIAALTNPGKYFISEPLDGSGCVELFLLDRRITALAGQRTNKNTKLYCFSFL